MKNVRLLQKKWRMIEGKRITEGTEREMDIGLT